MASKVSRKKRPLKEFYVLKERLKIEDSVFDRNSLIVLSKFMKMGLISTVDFPISRGKEANVYRATKKDNEFLAVKIYRIETTRFFNKMKYIVGDPRFDKVKKSKKNLAFAFAQKEFRNLKLCKSFGIPVPTPIAFRKNIILMEFIGDENGAYDQLRSVKPKNRSLLKKILNYIKIMYSNGLVHSDLSPYNILINNKQTSIYLIDYAQGVVKGHPLFEKFLERDVENILNYFKRKKDKEKILEWIRDKKDKKKNEK